ncbi:sulfur carrier protein ThiS [Isoptericola halotolerans]|uniref:sulfur carrier protein ThiS n=1 Tax=Isoptericola halotolerans TaxID=300560 RepID=UPI00388FA53B
MTSHDQRTGNPATARVNGADHDLGPTGAVPVTELVAELMPGHVADGAPRGLAVAIDDVVVPRGTWESTVVRAGDRVEIVTAVQGG